MYFTVKSWNAHSLSSSDYTASVAREFTPVTGTATPSETIQLDDFPKLGGVTLAGYDLPLEVTFMDGANVYTRERELSSWFSLLDTTPHKLVVTDMYSSTDFYVYGVPVAVSHGPDGPGQMAITLRVSDPVWKQNTVSTDTWAVTATSSDQTHVVTTAGNVDSYPWLYITPTNTKTGLAYQYGVFVEVYNQVSTGSSTSVPIELAYGPTTDDVWDTAALVGGNKMQADGDDLRVFVDGVEYERWIADINTTDTRVWTSIPLSTPYTYTLAVALTSDGVGSSEITVNEDNSAVPSSGILKIDSERFTYTGTTPASKKFTGVTIAAKGTTAAAHAGAATVRWIEHDIWIYYGSSDATAPSTTDTYKPMFDTSDSNNWQWSYSKFFDDRYMVSGSTDPLGECSRAGAWTYTNPAFYASIPNAFMYGGNQGTTTDGEWGEAGIYSQAETTNSTPSPYWYVDTPLGNNITGYDITGESYANAAAGLAYWNYSIGYGNPTSTSGITTVITAPTTDGSWTAYSSTNGSFNHSDIGVRYHYASNPSAPGTTDYGLFFEMGSMVLYYASTDIPVVSRSAEQASQYQIDATIANTTTAESIDLLYTITLNNALVVNTRDHTISTTDGVDAISALTIPLRPQWLRLQPGANTLTYTETGVAGVTIGIEWEDRVQ